MGKLFLNRRRLIYSYSKKKCNIAFKKCTDITLENIIFEFKLLNLNFLEYLTKQFETHESHTNSLGSTGGGGRKLDVFSPICTELNYI